MASIGTLTADMRLRSAAFLSELTRATRAVDSNTAAMRKSMREVERASRGVEKQFGQVRATAGALAGVLAVRQFTSFTQAAIDNADALAKQAAAIGISTRSLQEYRIVAGLAGVEQEKLDKGVGTFIKSLGELRAGTGAMNTLLDKTNVKLKEQLIATTSSEAALQLYLAAMANTANQADRLALSAAAFSRGAGVAMTNVVADGAESVEKLRRQMSELGLVMEDRTLRAAERLNDQWSLLTTAFQTGFDTAIIDGLSGSIDDSAESLKEARRIGEEFGQAVALSMRAVAAAGKFVAENFREIAAALAAVVAFKAASFFIGAAAAVTKFALALRAAAASGALFAAATSGLKKGLAGLAAAGTAIAVFAAAAKQIDPAIEDAINGLRGLEIASEGAASGIAGATDEVKKSTMALQLEATRNQQLAEALRRSTTEYEELKDAIEIETEAQRVGVDMTTKAGQAWLEAAREAQRYRKELADVERSNEEAERKAKDAAEEQKRRAEELRDLYLEPFRNAVSGIQTAFSDMFEGIFSGGIDSFGDLASAVKKIMIRLAAEVATLLVFRPVVDGLAGLAGLGGTGIGGGGLGGGSLTTRSVGGQPAESGGFGFGDLLGLGRSLGGDGLFGSSGLGGAIDTFGQSLGFGIGASNTTAGLLAAGVPAEAAAFGGIPSSAAAGSLTSASLTGILSGAGLGFGAGTFLNSLLGGHQTGGMIGSGGGALAGAVIGSVVPGVGTLLGGLIGGAAGGGIGGLFGPSPSVGPNGGFSFDAVNGRLQIGSSGGDNGFDPQSIRQLADAVTAGFNQFLDQTGARVNSVPYSVAQMFGGNLRAGIGSGDDAPVFGQDATAAANSLVLELIRSGSFSGLSADAQTVIANSKATTVEGLNSDLAFAETLAALGAPAATFEETLAAVNEQFNAMEMRAVKLGLAVENLNRVRDEELKKLKEQHEFEQRMLELQTDLSRYQASAANIAGAENIAAFLRTAEVQFASPAEQFTAAQSRFRELSADVRSGDASAVQPLLQTASSLIDLGRENFGSSVTFQNLDRNVRSTLATLGESLVAENVLDANVEATRQQTEVLANQLESIRDGLDAVRAELRQTRQQLASAA